MLQTEEVIVDGEYFVVHALLCGVAYVSKMKNLHVMRSSDLTLTSKSLAHPGVSRVPSRNSENLALASRLNRSTSLPYPNL